jgi:hypothetical protein
MHVICPGRFHEPPVETRARYERAIVAKFERLQVIWLDLEIDEFKWFGPEKGVKFWRVGIETRVRQRLSEACIFQLWGRLEDSKTPKELFFLVNVFEGFRPFKLQVHTLNKSQSILPRAMFTNIRLALSDPNPRFGDTHVSQRPWVGSRQETEKAKPPMLFPSCCTEQRTNQERTPLYDEPLHLTCRISEKAKLGNAMPPALGRLSTPLFLRHHPNKN